MDLAVGHTAVKASAPQYYNEYMCDLTLSGRRQETWELPILSFRIVFKTASNIRRRENKPPQTDQELVVAKNLLTQQRYCNIWYI